MIDTLHFLGTSIATSNATDQLRAQVRFLWDVAELSAIRPTSAEPSAVEIISCGPMTDDQRAIAARAPADQRGLSIETAGDHAVVIGAAMSATLDRTGDTFRISVHGDDAAPLALHVAIAEVVASSGLLPLHAAVVTRDRRTVALSGPSGAGKTTTAAFAAVEGWRFVAEDSSWLDPVTGDVYGSDVDLRLRSGAETVLAAPLLERFGVDISALEHDGYKRLVPYELIGGRVRVARLSELIVLAERDCRALDATLRPAEVVMALHQAAGVPLLASVRSRRSAIIGAIAASLPGRRLSAPSGGSGLGRDIAG